MLLIQFIPIQLVASIPNQGIYANTLISLLILLLLVYAIKCLRLSLASYIIQLYSYFAASLSLIIQVYSSSTQGQSLSRRISSIGGVPLGRRSIILLSSFWRGLYYQYFVRADLLSYRILLYSSEPLIQFREDSTTQQSATLIGGVYMLTSSSALAVVLNTPVIRQSALYQILASTQQTYLALLIKPRPPSGIYQQEAIYSMRGATVIVYSCLIYLAVMPYIDPAIPNRHTS